MKTKSFIKTVLKSNLIFIILMFVLFSFGCDTAGSSGDINLSFTGTKPGTLPNLSGSSQNFGVNRAVVSSQDITVYSTSGAVLGTITLTDARLALKEIKLKREGASESDDSIHFNGPYVVNLLNNTVSPSLSTIEVPPGDYNEIELKLDKIQGDELDSDGSQLVDNADDLYGNSIYLSGTYTGTTNGGTVTDAPFSLSFDFDETFELSGADVVEAFTIDADYTYPIIIAFRMSKWFVFNDVETNPDSVDFSNLVLRTGEIVLDENASDESANNVKIREVIEENIEESADYGVDDDGSGELESDEDDDPASEDANDD